MYVYTIPEDIEVFGKAVKEFPAGITETFSELISMLPANDARPYYAINECSDGKFKYIATALETYAGEADKYNYDEYTIEAGDYLCKSVKDWRTKTASIKNVFEDLGKNDLADTAKPLIELYKDENEMLCLVKTKAEADVFALINGRATKLLNIFTGIDEDDINEIPFADSWSPAQLINHVTKSNCSVATAMELKGHNTHRPADTRVHEIRNTFLDYYVKFQSPGFIIPEDGVYDKYLCITSFQKSVYALINAGKHANVSEAITHAAFGEITKLELLYFIVFHLQRHTRQLNKIILAL